MSELPPYQTYERITGQKWPGGRSKVIGLFLKLFWINEKPGSKEANLRLQENLIELVGEESI